MTFSASVSFLISPSFEMLEFRALPRSMAGDMISDPPRFGLIDQKLVIAKLCFGLRDFLPGFTLALATNYLVRDSRSLVEGNRAVVGC